MFEARYAPESRTQSAPRVGQRVGDDVRGGKSLNSDIRLAASLIQCACFSANK